MEFAEKSSFGTGKLYTQKSSNFPSFEFFTARRRNFIAGNFFYIFLATLFCPFHLFIRAYPNIIKVNITNILNDSIIWMEIFPEK